MPDERVSQKVRDDPQVVPFFNWRKLRALLQALKWLLSMCNRGSKCLEMVAAS